MKKTIIVVITLAVIGIVKFHGSDETGSAAKLVSSPNSSANTAAVSNTNTTTTQTTSSATYKNGTFTGTSEDTPYGTVQIAVIVNGNKITDVNFLQMPSDFGHSQEVTAAAEPLLKQVTLQKQSANIDFVSGATSTSYGYQASLQAALDQAVQS